MNLNDLVSTGARNDCVPAALALLTGEPAAVWLNRIRGYDGRACTAHRGVSSFTYVRVLTDAGFNVETLRFARGTQIHVLLSKLKGARALVVVRTRGRETHAIAAHGFMVADNARPRYQWYGDWLYTWTCAGFENPRVRRQAQCAYIITRRISQ